MLTEKSKYIKAQLKAAGITQAAIARELGVTRQCVNAGLNQEVVPRVRQYVSALLGLPEFELFPPPRRRGRKPKHNGSGAELSKDFENAPR